MIVLEDLAVTNTVRNRTLAKAIADCGWGAFRAMTAYKAASYGADVRHSGSSGVQSAVRQEPQGVSPESLSFRAESRQVLPLLPRDR